MNGGNTGHYFFDDLPNLHNLQHFEDMSPQLHRPYYPVAYLGIYWQKVKQSITAPGR